METGIQQSRVNDNKEISASSIGSKEKRVETDVNIVGGTSATRTSDEHSSASGTDLILANQQSFSSDTDESANRKPIYGSLLYNSTLPHGSETVTSHLDCS